MYHPSLCVHFVHGEVKCCTRESNMKKTENKWGKYLDDGKDNVKNDVYSQENQKNLHSGTLVKRSVTHKHHFPTHCINKR